MYKAVPKIYGSLFDIINDEFGKEGRGYIATFEKECMPRRGSDLIPELFPWAYLHISRLGKRLTEGTFYRNGRQGWYQATFSVVIIGMSKDGDVARLIANPDFTGDPTAQPPGLANIAAELMRFMYINYQTPSFPEEPDCQIPRWDADGVAVSGDAIIRKAAPEAEYNNLAEYLAAWQINFNFDIIEYF